MSQECFFCADLFQPIRLFILSVKLVLPGFGRLGYIRLSCDLVAADSAASLFCHSRFSRRILDRFLCPILRAAFSLTLVAPSTSPSFHLSFPILFFFVLTKFFPLLFFSLPRDSIQALKPLLSCHNGSGLFRSGIFSVLSFIQYRCHGRSRLKSWRPISGKLRVHFGFALSPLFCPRETD